MGGNDSSVEHTRVKKRQRVGTFERTVRFDYEAFSRRLGSGWHRIPVMARTTIYNNIVCFPLGTPQVSWFSVWGPKCTDFSMGERDMDC